MSLLTDNIVESEKAVVGTLLLYRGDALLEAQGLQAGDFYDPRHGGIFKAIQQLDDDHKPIDAISVWELLTIGGIAQQLEVLGGREYLNDLMASVVTPETIAFHVLRLKQGARRRAWGVFARKLLAKALDPSVSDEEVIDDGEGGSVRLTDDGFEEEAPRDMQPILRETISIIEKRSENRKTGVTGISYGIEPIDLFTQGMQGNEYIFIGGRPSMGKTAVAINFMCNTLKVSVPNLTFSLEMKDTALLQRALAREANVVSNKLKSGRLDQSDWINITRASSRMSMWPLRVDRRGSINMRDVRTVARRWYAEKRKHRCNECVQEGARECRHRIITFDYLQLLGAMPTDAKRQQNRQQELSETSRAIKLLAKELDCSIVVLGQLTRDLESRADKRPMLSDIRESGSIEQDADIVAFLYRDWVYNKPKYGESPKPEQPGEGETEFIIAKNREGETGTAHLEWDAHLQLFVAARKGLPQ